MSADLQNPIFTDEDAAREALEAVRWPDGATCPHCGSVERVAKVTGEKHRAGLYYCNECKGQFTVTVGTVFERSKIPLAKWWLATYLLGSSKKGMSAHQLHRILGVTYKTAWFMAHRIREAMTEGKIPGGMGGANKVVEIDETLIGGKAANRKNHVPKKSALLALVERDGKVRSFHVANVTGQLLRPIIVTHVNRASYIMTDDAAVYTSIGREFSGHGSVNHSAEEYVRAQFWHTNTVENYFSILKRGVIGVYHHVSEAHLHRYAAEFDFRYNNRDVPDMQRATIAAKGIEGKRLTYRPTDRQARA